jgi:hypothetical protein
VGGLRPGGMQPRLGPCRRLAAPPPLARPWDIAALCSDPTHQPPPRCPLTTHTTSAPPAGARVPRGGAGDGGPEGPEGLAGGLPGRRWPERGAAQAPDHRRGAGCQPGSHLHGRANQRWAGGGASGGGRVGHSRAATCCGPKGPQPLQRAVQGGWRGSLPGVRQVRR